MGLVTESVNTVMDWFQKGMTGNDDLDTRNDEQMTRDNDGQPSVLSQSTWRWWESIWSDLLSAYWIIGIPSKKLIYWLAGTWQLFILFRIDGIWTRSVNRARICESYLKAVPKVTHIRKLCGKWLISGNDSFGLWLILPNRDSLTTCDYSIMWLLHSRDIIGG